MSGLDQFSLFDLISLFYAFLGIRALWTLKQNWRAFSDNELTAFDRQLASQIAFFVFIPIGVFFHELGHAAATYQVGGTIDWFGGGFHYALFFGYVIPLGRFSFLQDWWIALAGNLVSVVYGFIPLILLRFTNKTWVKYTLLAFARIQLGWSLVGYPLLTFAGFEGDWNTIYFTNALLSVPLFIAHAGLGIALWRLDRSVRVKRWEFGLYAGATEPLRQCDNAVAARPGSIEPLIARGNLFGSQGQVDLALSDYRTALKLDPQNPRALFNIAQVRLIQKRYSEAEKILRGALERAAVEGDPQLAARIHYGLATALYQRGKPAEAVPEYDQAIARLPNVAQFYFSRGLARRGSHDEAGARSDFAHVVEFAVDDQELAQRAREMLSN